MSAIVPQHCPAAASPLFWSPAAPTEWAYPAAGSGQWVEHRSPSPGQPAARMAWEMNLSVLWGLGWGL